MKSREENNSPVCSDNLIDSGVSILKVWTLRDLFMQLRFRIGHHLLFSLGTRKGQL